MAQHADIASTYREFYRAKFRDDVLAGTKKPFLVPLYFLGVWILPTLYLAIPHKDRPWLYKARWLVLAFVVVFNFHMILNVSSHNFASAYGAGLIGAWGIIWTFTVLVWTKPQWEAKRVDIRKKSRVEKPESNGDRELSTPSLSTTSGNGHAPRKTSGKQSSHLSSVPQQRRNASGEGSEEEPGVAETSGRELNGHAANGDGLSRSLKERRTHADTAQPLLEWTSMPGESRKELLEAIPSLRQNENGATSAADLEKLAAGQEFEYYWQEYPADASFWTRLDWAFDIVSTFRMTGWNWAIPCLPPYEPPATFGSFQLPLNSVGPQRTKQGYTRELSYTKFFLSRLFLDIIPSYVIVDFCAVHMTADPYFVLGPEHNLPLPPHLASHSPLLLSAQRTALSFVGVVSALQLTFNAGALALAFLPPLPQTLRFRSHPWHLPTPFGSFARVLDRGLAGFWGAWWHQTFRFGFAAPARWLLRRGYVDPGTPRARAAAAVVAFAQSGFLHASGSYSTVPNGTRWFLPPLFFLLAGVGTVLQSWLSRAVLRAYITRLPRWMRRLGNLVFVLVWMWMTSWLLIDDFGRCGLWMFEPVPVSIFRALKYGPSQDHRVWRYERDFWPRWYWGKHWWDSGIGV
ncbi:membrane bound O-acyl transferase family-domain-containing protein [Hypoxylon crocopeplum]|nr:membrane bound O-acyl transferase family-domain-containing protein [Hypoxylon crocopeplum]